MIQLSGIRFTAGSYADVESGLVAYVRFRLGGIEVDGVTVRRARDGRLVLSFPARRDRAGRDHAIVAPINEAARRAIEAQVLASLPPDLLADLGVTIATHPSHED